MTTEATPAKVRLIDQLGPAVDAALVQYAQAVWHDTEAAVRERYAELEDAVRARIAEQVAAERERCARLAEHQAECNGLAAGWHIAAEIRGA